MKVYVVTETEDVSGEARGEAATETRVLGVFRDEERARVVANERRRGWTEVEEFELDDGDDGMKLIDKPPKM